MLLFQHKNYIRILRDRIEIVHRVSRTKMIFVLVAVAVHDIHIVNGWIGDGVLVPVTVDGPMSRRCQTLRKSEI